MQQMGQAAQQMGQADQPVLNQISTYDDDKQPDSLPPAKRQKIGELSEAPSIVPLIKPAITAANQPAKPASFPRLPDIKPLAVSNASATQLISEQGAPVHALNGGGPKPTSTPQSISASTSNEEQQTEASFQTNGILSSTSPANINFEKLYDSMQEYLENIPMDPTPAELETDLLNHQRQALHWLVRQETKKSIKGGILADDMGLGKTLETISLICAHKVTPTLVICPVSTISHWFEEIAQHVSYGVITVRLHYGSSRLKSARDVDDDKLCVVITSYGTVAAEYRDKPEKQILKSIKWARIILDEAHFIKNKSTIAAKAVCDLEATYRLALTGTPIQNALDDLYSLLLFLRFPEYESYAIWKQEIALPIKHNLVSGLSKLQQVLRRVLLRRRKNQCINGEPIIKLPTVTTHLRLLVMEQMEKTFYVALERQSLKLFEELMEQGEKNVMKNYWHVLELLLRLRQSCDHPFIVLLSMYKDKFKGVVPFSVLEASYSDFVKDASGTQAQVLQSLGATVNGDGPVLLCGICEEEFEVPLVTPCSHFFCQSCIVEHLENSTKCPICEKVVTVSRLRDAKDTLEDLKSKQAFTTPTAPCRVDSGGISVSAVPAVKENVPVVEEPKPVVPEPTPVAPSAPVEVPTKQMPCLPASHTAPPQKPSAIPLAARPKAHVSPLISRELARMKSMKERPPPVRPSAPKFSPVTPSAVGTAKISLQQQPLQQQRPQDQQEQEQPPQPQQEQTRQLNTVSIPTTEPKVTPSLEEADDVGVESSDIEDQIRERFFSSPNVYLEALGKKDAAQADTKTLSQDFLNLFLPDPSAPSETLYDSDSSDDESNIYSSSQQALVRLLSGKRKGSLPVKRDRPTFEEYGHYTSSTKIEGLMQILKEIPSNEKDLLECKLRTLRIKLVRLDGKMPQKERQAAIQRFNTKQSVRIFLISLRAGGLGINLVAANHVVLLDPWWNPALEQQAIDRVYRIGQTKPVHVYKFAIKDTVEERITKLQSYKKLLADSALTDRREAAAESAHLTFEDLQLLFTAPSK